MAMPGFTAEVSMYQTSGHYRLAALSTGNVGIYAIPATQRRITPFAGGGNGGSIQCRRETDPNGDCSVNMGGTGFFQCSVDPNTGTCIPTGNCCTPPPPPPPPTVADCFYDAKTCFGAACVLPGVISCLPEEACMNALEGCLNRLGIQTR